MNKLDYSEALATENNLPPGPYEIRCFLEYPLTRAEIRELELSLIEAGVDLISISQRGTMLLIRAVKPAEPPEGISFLPALIATPFVAAIGILGGLAITAYIIHELPRVLDAMIPITVILVVGYVITKR